MEELLRRIPIFATLPPDEVRFLAGSLRPVMIPSGAILFNEGEPGERFSIVVDGQIEIIKAFGTIDERLVNVVGPGDFMGELSLFSPGSPRSATARARTPARLLEMAADDFERLVNGKAPLAVAILTELSRRLQRSDNSTIADLQEKNRQLAQALETLQEAQEQLLEKEKLEQELSLARSIQEGILPKELPQVPGWQVAVFWQPARAVGGDFYDFLPLGDNRIAVLIGDVSGKGMPAALVMAITRTLLRFAALNAASEEQIQPGRVLAAVNEMACLEIPAKMFITCLFAVADLSSGRIRFANAGHTLPYQCTRQGIIELRATGMPLGLLPGMAYDESETALEEGESLFLCTDGLIEAHNVEKEMYGAPRLRAHLEAESCRPGCISAVVDRLVKFCGSGSEQEDDITCIVLERSG